MFRNRQVGGSPAVDRHALRCSFCHKGERDVRKLIAGPSVCICDECVQVCVGIIRDDDRLEAQPRTGERPASPWLAPPAGAGAVSIPCGLCRALTATVALLWVPGRGALCPGCVAEIQAVLRGGDDAG